MQKSLRIGLLSRSLGPTCSNVEYFYSSIDSRLYRVYGVPGGAILVQKLPITKEENLKESVVTEIVIDGFPSTTSSLVDDTQLLSITPSPSILLASTTLHDLSFYSLTLPKKPGQEVESPRKKEPLFERLLSVPFPGVLAMSWTENGEGLLLSDLRCQITCVVISTETIPHSTGTLERRSMSYRSEKVYSMDILWVEKFTQPQSSLCAGYSAISAFASVSKKTTSQWRIVLPGKPHQEIFQYSSVSSCSWSPQFAQGSVRAKSCLLNVSSDNTIRIWKDSTSRMHPAIGAGLLDGDLAPNMQNYSLEAVIEIPEKDNLIPGSLQATWLKQIFRQQLDPRLAWIICTYSVFHHGISEQFCRVYVVHGLPLELAGTQVGPSRIFTYLQGSLPLRQGHPSSHTLYGVLLDLDPQPCLLLTETSSQDSLNSTETHTSLITVQKETQILPKSVQLTVESQASSEIVGFLSQVSQLAPHPRYDLVCVLTEQKFLSLWDLWPVRKLQVIQGPDLGVGSWISTLCWVEMEVRLKHGELGYLLISGESSIVVCLASSDLIKGIGKPSVMIQTLASFQFPHVLNLDQITPFSSTLKPEATKQDVKYIARSKISETDQESYHLIHLQIQESSDSNLTLSAIQTLPADSKWTVFEQVQDEVVVGGTLEGTLEFYGLSIDAEFQLLSRCLLSTTPTDPTSFVSCLSACQHSCYLACVTSFDIHQNEDKLRILQSDSTYGTLDYRLEDQFISSSGIISQISWVQTTSPILRLVVGYQAGQVDVFTRTRQGVWVVVGSYVSSLKITNLSTSHLGLPIVGAGTHMLFLSNDSRITSPHLMDTTSVMQEALMNGGPMSEYHPFALLVLLHVGHLDSISAVLHQLVEFLKDWQDTPEDERLEEVYPPTIIGPSSDLDQSFVEAIAPSYHLLNIGSEIIQSVPFQSTQDKTESSNLHPGETEKSKQAKEKKKEDTGLMTGQFDMSAFGLSMDTRGFSSEEEEITESKETINKEDPPEGNGHLEDLGVVEDDCLMFQLEKDFEQKTKNLLFSTPQTGMEFDKEYLQTVLKIFSKRNEQDKEESALPLDCLLRLSESNLSLLREVLTEFTSWRSELTELQLDNPGKKFLTAVKLIPCAQMYQAKTSDSKKENSVLHKESFVSPFLKIESSENHSSDASVASSQGSPDWTERLAASYVSWPEQVGLSPGIESIHLLWAVESQDSTSLLHHCLQSVAGSLPVERRVSWERLKATGAGFWLKSKPDVLLIAEEIAKEQFRRKNDPHDCALMYIALQKQHLLSRLFRSNGFARVADLLTKDFTIEQNKQAAAKNAFVLLGQHRYSLAAAFFLVGGYQQDAIGVCAKEMKDPQLALFLATLLDNGDQKLKKEIILKELYPQTLETEDRVAQGLLLWITEQYFEALDTISTVKALKSELSIADRAISKILLFQFVFFYGLPKLSDRFVPLWLFHQMRNLASHCAHVLETCGLPSLALRALQTAQFLHSKIPNSTANLHFANWMPRLVTGMMIRHLPSLHAVQARDPAMILWHQHIQQDVDALNQLGISLNFELVLHQMQYIMDCLYEVPCAPVFPRETSHRPELMCKRMGSTSSKKLMMEVGMESHEEVEKKEDEEKVGRLYVSPRCYELLHIDGDRCVGVCFSKSEGFQSRSKPLSSIRRAACATGKHGIHFIDWDSTDQLQQSTSTSGVDGLMEEVRKQDWPSRNWLVNSSVMSSHNHLVSMKEVNPGGPLKPHPSSTFFLSSSGEDSIYLWQFDTGTPSAQYLLPSNRLTFDSVHHVGWNSSGDRITAIDSGGVCGVWRVHSAQQSSSTGVADWTHQVCSKKGNDVEFVDWSGSVVCTSGEDELGKGLIALWDTLAPNHSCRISHLQYRNPINELTTIPGTLIFLSALESGTIQAHDFRMLSSTESKLLWSLNSIHDGPITSLEVGWTPSFQDPKTHELTVVSGGKDGDICISNGIKEKGYLRQRIRKAHWRKSGQLAHLLFSGLRGSLGHVSIPQYGVERLQPESCTGSIILDLDWCDEGLLTAGSDGYVQLFPWSF